jgi:exodeoxyribonuclease V gamma subunit
VTLDLRIAARPEPLLDALTGWLEAVPDDPFAFDLVVVPNAGMREWVAAQLVDRLGVLSNVEFVFPAELTRRALGLPDPADDPWRPERLAWHVLALMVEGADLGATPWEGVPSRPWAVARRVADLLERYASQRPDLIGRWGAGGAAGAEDDPARAWQQATWRALRTRVGAPSSAERLLDALAAEPPSGAGGLPARLAVMGVSSLSAPAAAVIAHAARSSDVLVLATAAAMAALRHELGVDAGAAVGGAAGGVAGAERVTRPSVASDPRALLVAPTRPLDLEPATHPLLLTWGRPALEAATMLARLPVAPTLLDGPPVPLVDVDVDVDVPAGAAATQLAALQSAVHAGIASAPSRLDRERDGDGSVQVHACHGLVRQLEVLRDAILHAMAADPTLLPRDVAVLCADLEAVAPIAVPILGADVGGRSLPVLVTDRAATTTPPVQAALDAALALTTSRLERDEVLTFLALPVVSAALGLEPDDLVLLERTADVLDVRWGQDGEHRGRWGYPRDVTVGTWRETLDRLLAGLLLDADGGADGDADGLLVGGIAPAVGVGTQEVGRVGRLADALAAVEHLSRFAARPLPMSDWAAPLRWLVDTLLRPLRAVDTTSHAFASQAGEVRRVVDELVADARQAGVEHPLDVREVRAALADRMSSGGSRARLRTGHVSVASLTPLRGVPFRLVALVGVGDGLVSSARSDDDDVLALAPRLGERDAADERRAALLDAVLAARGTLIVTCDGQDVRTGATLELPTVVEELLDALPVVARDARDAGDRGEGGAPLVVRHPRHLADRRNLTLGAGSLPRVDRDVPWTFSPAALRTLGAYEAVDPDVAPGVGVLTEIAEDGAHEARDGSDGHEGRDGPRWRGRMLARTTRRTSVHGHGSGPEHAATAALDEGAFVQLRLDDVLEALRRPSRVLLRERLGVRLPDELASSPRPIELWVEDPLARWRFSEELLAHLVAGGTADGWIATRPAYGGLPPGPVGRDLLASFVDEVTELHGLAGRPVVARVGADAQRGQLSSVPVSVELEVASEALGVQRVRLVGSVAQLDGTIVDVSATKDHPSQVVDAAVRLLAVTAQGVGDDAAPVAGARVVRAAPSAKEGPAVRELTVHGVDAQERARHAAAALARVVDLALRVRTGPAPLLPRAAWTLGGDGGADVDVSRPPTGVLATDVERDLKDPAVRVVLGVGSLPELAHQADGPLERGLPDAATPVQRWSCALVGALSDALDVGVDAEVDGDVADGAR